MNFQLNFSFQILYILVSYEKENAEKTQNIKSTSCNRVFSQYSFVFFAAAAASDGVTAEATDDMRTVVRSRRNVPVVPILPVPHMKRLPDFWGWYKYFMDSHNQEGVSMDCCCF